MFQLHSKSKASMPDTTLHTESSIKSVSSLSTALFKLLHYKLSSKRLVELDPFSSFSPSNQMQIGYPCLIHSTALVYEESTQKEWGYRKEYDASMVGSSTSSRSRSESTSSSNYSESSQRGCENGGDEIELVEIEVLHEAERDVIGDEGVSTRYRSVEDRGSNSLSVLEGGS